MTSPPTQLGRARAVFNRTVKPVWVTARSAGNRLVERHYGIRTIGEVKLAGLGLTREGLNDYRASQWTVLPRILRRRDVGTDDVFIDVGSGLGRVVVQAATRYPFRRVVGVELSPELTAAAEANVAAARRRLRSADVELVTADATTYEVPDDVTIVFLGNPFTGQPFREFFGRLLDSVDRRPRRVRVIYHAPMEHEFLLSTGRVRPTRRLRGFRPGRDWARSNSTQMYELRPSNH